MEDSCDLNGHRLLQHQKDVPTELAKLERKIQAEIEKENPDINLLMQQFKKRREELASGRNASLHKHSILKFTHLPSKSTFGKISEAHLCKKYCNSQKDAQMGFVPSDKLSVEILAGKLMQAAGLISDDWRTQRNYNEYIDALIERLSPSKKE